MREENFEDVINGSQPSSRVDDYETLTALVKFGFAANLHKRLGMALSFGSGIFLEVLRETPNFPFMIAATSDYGYERFLCPVIGESNICCFCDYVWLVSVLLISGDKECGQKKTKSGELIS